MREGRDSRGGDRARARPAGLPGLVVAVPRVVLCEAERGTGPEGGAWVGRDPAYDDNTMDEVVRYVNEVTKRTVVKPQLVRPERRLDLPGDRRIADLPRPEEPARECHRVHLGHDEVLDRGLHVLRPVRPVVPLGAFSERRPGPDADDPLAAVVDRGAPFTCDRDAEVALGLVIRVCLTSD